MQFEKQFDPRVAVSPSEAARLIGIGRTTLYVEMGAGRLRSLKIGARRLIPMAAIEEWITARQAETEGRANAR